MTKERMIETIVRLFEERRILILRNEKLVQEFSIWPPFRNDDEIDPRRQRTRIEDSSLIESNSSLIAHEGKRG